MVFNEFRCLEPNRFTVRKTSGSSNTVAVNTHGQIVADTGTPGVSSSFTYGYDKASRLTRTRQQNTEGTCTVRAYGFDKNSNRTTLATATSTSVAVTGEGEDAACPTTLTTTTSTFDTGDRITDGSVYDAFGRATTTASATGPGAASTQTYYVNDLARSQTTGTDRTTWSLDPAGRFLAATQESNSTGTWTTTAVKTNHYDSTGDNPRWISENTAGTTITRYVDGIDGDMVASTTATGDTILQLSDIHGDTVLQLPLTAGNAPTALDTDEYGNPTTATKTTGARYTWLGAKQRSTETPTGMTLMGIRLYNPTTGRFLSVDPVPGGNPNAYTYPTDPINMFDLDGNWGRPRWMHRAGRNKYWRTTYYGARLGVDVAAFASGASAFRGAYRGYRFYRKMKKKGMRASFRSCGRGRYRYAKCAGRGVSAAFGVTDMYRSVRKIHRIWRPYHRPRIYAPARRWRRSYYY